MPEKSRTEIPRDLRDLYEKGLVALQRSNLDYAIALFGQVLQREPGFFECREALRATQFKRAGGKGGFLKKFLGSAGSSPQLAKYQLAVKSRPLEALLGAEQILNGDPANAAAHRLLAEAAMQAGLHRTAILSLEILNKNTPDRDIAMRLGQALDAAGQIARAESLYSELLKAFPHDSDIAQALKDITARRTLSEGGYEELADGTGSYRNILKDKEEAVSLEQEHREIKSEEVIDRLLGEHEARLLNEPKNLRLRRTIAELYAQKKDFDRSLAMYREILGEEGSADPTLEQAMADTRVKQFEHELSQLDPSAEDYVQRSGELTRDKDQYRLAELQKRVERYPNDLALRFDLGKLYFEAGTLGKAIQEFQKSQVNPHKRIASLYYLGRCFGRRKMNDLAVRTFNNALAEKQVFDTEKKEILYELGCALERMGKADESIERLKQIYEVDIGFRDVADRVDAYYDQQDES